MTEIDELRAEVARLTAERDAMTAVALNIGTNVLGLPGPMAIERLRLSFNAWLHEPTVTEFAAKFFDA